MKLKKGDMVTVVTGKDKGKTGAIEKVFVKEEKVLVAGVNEYKRHMKSRMQGQKSGIFTITKPLSVANVSFVCPKCKKLSRLGYVFRGDKKARICKKCEAVI